MRKIILGICICLSQIAPAQNTFKAIIKDSLTKEALILRSFDSASLTGAYQAIYAPGTEAACFFLRIVNHSNTSITISYDGVNANEFLLPTSDL